MACFLVPAAEAVITTITKRVAAKREQEALESGISTDEDGKVSLSRKLSWLNNMLWGGSALLLFEHVWHGEVVPWFPFLTNAANAADRAEMFSEMATSGVGMAALVSLVWAGMVVFSNRLEKRRADMGEESR